MAANYFQKSNTTVHAARLDTGVANLRQGIAQIRELYALMTNMRDGTDFTLLETNLGLAAGQGVLLYNMVGGTLTLIDELDAGQPNRLQKLITRWN